MDHYSTSTLSGKPPDAVWDADVAPADGLYRIRRTIDGRTRVVYVHILSSDFLPEYEKVHGPSVIQRLSKLDEWCHNWSTLTISANGSNLQISADTFEPHSISPEYVHHGYPLFDAAQFKREHRVNHRVWRCPGRGAETYVKLARFQFEVKLLEREVKTYHLLRDSPLVPSLLGYVFEESPDRVVGIVIEQLIGRYPDLADYDACCAALRNLHEVGILHGDLNKHNIIITESGPKFIDMEMSKCRQEVTDWTQSAQQEIRDLHWWLSDQSGMGRPWRM